MSQAPLTVRRWSRAEYERLVDLGVFRGDPVELLGGRLIVAEPQSSPHATAVGAADDALRAVLPVGFFVRAQMPLALDEESAPEPDLAVVAGRRSDYRTGHPTSPVLVVEVADSSLRFDREDKGSLYARARVPETASWRCIAIRARTRRPPTGGATGRRCVSGLPRRSSPSGSRPPGFECRICSARPSRYSGR
jgi:Uma2 family endonuclease